MLLVPLVKALLVIARYFKRQAIAQESLVALYREDCASRGIYAPASDLDRKKFADDKIEISYGSTHTSNPPPPEYDEDEAN